MKAISAALALLLLFAGVQAVAGGAVPDIWWQQLLGGSDWEGIFSADRTADGGYVLLGGSSSSQSGDVAGTSHGGADFWLVKLDGVGAIEWQRLLGGSGDDDGFSVRQTSDGGYILLGYSDSSQSGDVTGVSHGGGDLWVVKTDAYGTIQWQQLFGGSGWEGTGQAGDYSVQQTSDGGYVLCGFSASSASGDVNGVNHGGTDYWVVKLSGTGGIQWQRLLGGSGDDRAASVQRASDGGYVVCGYSRSSANGDVTGTSHGTDDVWLVKLTAAGTTQWQRLLGGALGEGANSIQQTSDGGFVILGGTPTSQSGDVTGLPHGSCDCWVVKVTSLGEIEWQRLLGGSNWDSGISVRQAPDGGYLLLCDTFSSQSGDVTGTNLGVNDLWVVKLSGTGSLQWQRLLGGTGYEATAAVLPTADGGCVVTGISASSVSGDVTGTGHGDCDAWVVRMGPPLVPAFTATPVTGLSPLTVQFTDTSNPAPTTWHWDFGDGQTSATQSPSHSFANAGTYTVTLTVTYEGGVTRSVTKTNLVAVNQSLHAAYTVGSRIGYAPYTAVFTDQTTGNPTTWLWEFGDGQTSTAKSPAHTYAARGNYTVRLTVTNPYDTRTATKTDYIRVLALWNGLVRVEAEDYDYDHPTEGVGYHDTTAGNSGGAYRSEDVDIEAISSTMKLGYAVTDVAEGEWTRYWVTSPAPYEYDFPLSLRLSGWAAGQRITVSAVGTGDSVDMAVPDTGQASTYALANATLRLEPGANIVRLTYHGSAMNVDYFTLDPSGVMPIKQLPGVSIAPLSLKLIGKFDDVNGNGRADFADVVLYFTQMDWIAANEPVSAFDYNGNGRIDFSDIVWLFTNL